MQNRTLQQYTYHQWANGRIFSRLNELPAAVYDREIKSVFSSIEEVIVHIYQTDGMWLSVMSGDSFEETMAIIKQLKRNAAEKDLDGMRELYADLADRFESFFNEQDDLDTVISIEHPRYGKLETPISSLVQHVVNHGTYHRGNITAMLRQQGHAGVPTDFVFFLYEDTP